ncbi:MAG: AbgT family transporter [Hyphomonadaceae bacterium]|nr:AbgT family transporter [Hyphomonadaceae bacterium]
MGHGTVLAGRRNRLLDGVERLGNALPDPIFIFIGIIILLVVVSIIGASAGWSALNPVTGETLVATSLLSEANVQKLFVEMPRTYTSFAPLGIALTIMLGAGVADRSGLLTALMRASLGGVPKHILVPMIFVLGMLATHTNDAAYMVYVPLAGIVFAAAGRHPVLGLISGFAGAAVGLAGNLFPGQYDVLLLGITETGARLLDPEWTMNPLGNWYFSVGIAIAFTSIGWWVIERVVAPRLGAWDGESGVADLAGVALSPIEKRGLVAAGIAALAVAGLVAALILWPGYTPLFDEAATSGQPITPFFRSIAAVLFLLFISTGWAYGAVTGTIKTHRDVVGMMVKGLEVILPYLVLIFFAAHFVAMFGWSNLGPITAIAGAEQLRAMSAPPAVLLPILATMSAWLDFLIASGSAKWAAMAPVATPMLMLLEVSPEMTTAAYRVGDTVTNLISPLNPYVVLTLVFAQRWVPGFRLGSLIALLLPLAAAFYVCGMLLVAGWVAFDLPVGPGATVGYELPTSQN